MAKNQECSTCKFFLEYCDEESIGYCRRFPPQFKITDVFKNTPHEEHAFLNVMTDNDNWCGEYKSL